MYKFSFPVQVEEGATNPANHLAHHNHILLFQKARIAYLKQFGWSEENIAGFGMFIVEVNCQYQREIFQGDELEIKCRADELSRKVFTMSYLIENKARVCAQGLTKSVCVDPVTRRSVPLPKAFVSAVNRFEA